MQSLLAIESFISESFSSYMENDAQELLYQEEGDGSSEKRKIRTELLDDALVLMLNEVLLHCRCQQSNPLHITAAIS